MFRFTQCIPLLMVKLIIQHFGIRLILPEIISRFFSNNYTLNIIYCSTQTTSKQCIKQNHFKRYFAEHHIKHLRRRRNNYYIMPMVWVFITKSNILRLQAVKTRVFRLTGCYDRIDKMHLDLEIITLKI